MADVINHDVEAFNCVHAQKVHVAFFGEDYLVNRGVAFGGEDGVAGVALDDTIR